ncbi:uncharacterized protein [Haliotis asinina]|uniref:uncharacterized protein n=1 Tax=Haliotis asinina TaxID=109174 RepID=UPI00353270BC
MWLCLVMLSVLPVYNRPNVRSAQRRNPQYANIYAVVCVPLRQMTERYTRELYLDRNKNIMGNIQFCWSRPRYQKLFHTNNYIASHYEPQLVHRGQTPWNHEHAVTEDELDTPVSARDLGRVASHIGMEFESVGIELRLTLVTLEQGKVRHPWSLYMQIVHMLTKWKEKNGRSATGLVLVRALWRCKDRCTIEWEDILKILQ